MTKATIRLGWTGFILFCYGCGGGNGVGPEEIRKREDKLRDQIPIGWQAYNQGDWQGSIDFFTDILEQADAVEGIELSARNQIKAEAQNGIGWSFFRQQELEGAATAFNISTRLDRRNADVWVGWAGVSLAQEDYSQVLQFAIQALEVDPEYNSGIRLDPIGRLLGHDQFDKRQVRILLAEAYFHLGRYSAIDRPDPNNAAAQVRLLRNSYRFVDPGQLLEAISEAALELQNEISSGA